MGEEMIGKADVRDTGSREREEWRKGLEEKMSKEKKSKRKEAGRE